MKTIKRNFCLLITLFVSISIYAQTSRSGLYGETGFKAFSIGSSSGITYYYGDVEKATGTFIDKKEQINFFVEGNFSYSFWEYIALKLNIIYGHLSGVRDRYSFKSNFIEPSVNIEYHPFSLLNSTKDFYITLGFGSTFSQIRSHDTQFVDSFKTSKIAPIVIGGLGYRYLFSNGLWVGVQLVNHVVVIDNVNFNLDGYPYAFGGNIVRGSQSKYNDGYLMLGLTLGYQWSK